MTGIAGVVFRNNVSHEFLEHFRFQNRGNHYRDHFRVLAVVRLIHVMTYSQTPLPANACHAGFTAFVFQFVA